MDDRLDRSKMYCRTSYHPPTRIEPSTDTGLNSDPENGLHAFATIGRVRPRGCEGEGQRKRIYARVQERDAGADGDGGLCGHESSTSLRLSGAVSGVGLCLAATRREVHHPVTTSAVTLLIDVQEN